MCAAAVSQWSSAKTGVMCSRFEVVIGEYQLVDCSLCLRLWKWYAAFSLKQTFSGLKTCAILCSVLLRSVLIEFVKNKSTYVWHGYAYAIGMFCSSIFGVLCIHHNYNIGYTTGLRIRTALTSAIYRKVCILALHWPFVPFFTCIWWVFHIVGHYVQDELTGDRLNKLCN